MTGRAFINGEDMLLKPKEFAVMRLLAENRGMVISKETIYKEVWGHPMNNDDSAVKYQIYGLRKKLGGSSFAIVSEYSEGYRLEEL
jgi:DNA-binding response OmpR family regulator